MKRPVFYYILNYALNKLKVLSHICSISRSAVEMHFCILGLGCMVNLVKSCVVLTNCCSFHKQQDTPWPRALGVSSISLYTVAGGSKLSTQHPTLTASSRVPLFASGNRAAYLQTLAIGTTHPFFWHGKLLLEIERLGWIWHDGCQHIFSIHNNPARDIHKCTQLIS